MRRFILCFSVIACMAIGASSALALQSGGVEIGDENGSVVGQLFSELPIDLELFAIDVGPAKVWYPPTSILDLKARPGRPVVIKVTNKSSVDRGFLMTADSDQAAPTVLKAQVVLKPGESKFIGVPLSDLLYAITGSTFIYKDQVLPNSVGGKLLIIR